RVENQPPASRPITLRPALTSGSTATPPTAPSPITTTSVLGSSVAMGTSLLGNGSRVHRILGVGRYVIGRLPAGCQASALADLFRCGDDAHPWITNHVPANEIAVATVIGIAEGAVDDMIANHVEEPGAQRGKATDLVLRHRL